MVHATELLGAEVHDARGNYVGRVREMFIVPAEQPNRVARMLLGRGRYQPLIARYDQMAILETLRDKVGHDAPCPGLWLLVASDGQNDMPKLDHAEIPLITPGQRAKVSEAWIDNVHRGRAEPVAAIAGSGRKGSN